MSELEFTNATAARHLMSRRRLIRKLRQTRSLLRMVRSDLRAVRDSCYGLTRERDRLASLDYELSDIESALDDCAPRVADGRTLSPAERVWWLRDENARINDESSQLIAAVDKAARDHAAVEAERARLSRAVETAEAARDSALEMAADAFRNRDSAQADRDYARSAADIYLAQAREAQAERERVEAESRAIADAYNALAGEAAGLRRDRDAARAQLATAESEQTKLYQCASEQGEADVGNGLVIVRKAALTALRSRQTGADAATVRLLHELLDRLLVTGSEVKA